jgi:predicted amino acid-binding ACT domain protein
MNLDFDMGESFPADHQVALPQQLGIEARLGNPHSQITGLVKQEDSNIPTTENLDVKAELESLLVSLQLATTPSSPQLEPIAEASQGRFDKAEQMLGAIEQIHAELATNLAKFGGHAEIRAMLAQLETTRHSLVIAHDRATTGQEAFYDSLRAIQSDVTTRSEESAQKLAQYQASIQSLSQTIAADRLQIASMSVDLSTKLTDLHNLNTQIAAKHTEIVTAAQTMKSRIVEIDRGFVELVASVQTEKEQFYELTVETIEKADAIKSQLANISNQISADRELISALKAELESVRHLVRQETEHKLNNLDLRYHQIISMWDEFQTRHKDRIFNTHKFARWLWILSTAVICIFVMLIRVLMILK